MGNGQFNRALPLLERSLSIMKENLPGEHLDLKNGEIICTVQRLRDFMSNSKRNVSITDGQFVLFVLSKLHGPLHITQVFKTPGNSLITKDEEAALCEFTVKGYLCAC